MTSLLQETLNTLQKINKAPEDILFIGDKKGNWKISWEYFQQIADKEYDSGFGTVKVKLNLVIVFKDNSWLEREEYDGAEWWTYKKCPTLKSNAKEVKDENVIWNK